jgi:hypothetical protein
VGNGAAETEDGVEGVGVDCASKDDMALPFFVGGGFGTSGIAHGALAFIKIEFTRLTLTCP